MRRVILAICATAAALVLLLSFKTHTRQAATGGSPASAIGTPAPGGTAPAAGPASGAGRAVTGDAVPTIYGPVQIRITVSGTRITSATAVVYPAGTPMDAQINALAVPKLDAEAVAANSAGIDAVSGATYTSRGYIGSLQSAIDQAAR